MPRALESFDRIIGTGRGVVTVGFFSTLLWVCLCLSPPRLFHLIDYKMYDVMHRRLPVPAAHGSPVIVDIDEKSLTEIGQWPWPRYTMSRLLARIQDMDAGAVGLDIVFAESDRTSVHILERDLSLEVRAKVRIVGVPDNYRNNDAMFADTLKSGPFVLGYPFFYAPKHIPHTGSPELHALNLMVTSSTGAEATELDLPVAQDVTPNLEGFREAASASGFINASPDEDGVLRKIGMVTQYGERCYPGLALATFLRSNRTRTVVLEATGRTPEYLRITVQGETRRLPLDAKGHLLIRYYSPPGFFERISASDILNGRSPFQTLEGRIVFIGSSAPALSDAHPTPLHPLVPGIDLHATVAQNILWNDFIAIPWWAVWAECGGVVVAGLFSTVLLLWRRTLAGFLVTGSTALGIWYASQAILSHAGIFFSPQFPVIVMVGNFSVLTLVKFMREERASREKTDMILKAQELTLHGLAALAETRDNETGNHLIRTQEYVRLLAEHLRRNSLAYPDLLDDDAVTYLYKTAPLHDIGKVGIPDRILLKPGSLTGEEFEIMKRHPMYGRDALRRAEERMGYQLISPYFRFARDVVYSHHEKWSGGGYPEGLVGEDIPLAGRLMALADVYDALRTRRVYKSPYSHEKARGIILAGRGVHFDPAMVDAFLAQEDRFIEVSERYADLEELEENPGWKLDVETRETEKNDPSAGGVTPAGE